MSPGRGLDPFVVGVALALFLVGCGPPAVPSPSPLDSGIRGLVQLGPTCPVETRDVPCVTPYVAQLVILEASGEAREVGRVTSGEDGRFEVPLPAGEYTIVPTPGDPFPLALPQDVVVAPGAWTEIQVNYDTGIRAPE